MGARDEDPDAIIAKIANGLIASGRQEESDFWRQPNRRDAIAFAFEQALPLIRKNIINSNTLQTIGSSDLYLKSRSVASGARS